MAQLDGYKREVPFILWSTAKLGSPQLSHGRSSTYCTDVGKPHYRQFYTSTQMMWKRGSRHALAVAYRTVLKEMSLWLLGYRKYGHNEEMNRDLPSQNYIRPSLITNPRDIYAEKLI